MHSTATGARTMVSQTQQKTSLDPVDFLGLDTLLTDEDRLLAETCRRFAADQLLPYVGDWFEAGTLPRSVAFELGKLGLLGMHLTGYGCAGASATSYGVACRELEAVDSGLRSLISVQGSLSMFAIWKYGSEEQRVQWLAPMAAGEAIGCFGLTEPDHGSDPSAMKTTARRAGGDWVLSGTKTWITNGSLSDIAVVWAQTDGGIRGFLVPRDTPGFTVRDIHRKLSLRASVTSELALEDCRVPDSAVFPEATGLGAALSCLSEARYGIVWGAVGAARTCYETALDYARSRTQFGKPIAGFQLTQQKLVDMMLAINKSMLLALRIGEMKDAGVLRPQHVSVGKLNNVREALEVARKARTILGANGISLEYPVMRHANNLESVLTYEGTGEIHTLILGQALTGLPAFA